MTFFPEVVQLSFFESSIELGKAAIIAALQNIYWLAKEEVPHTTKYVPLLTEVFGCEPCMLDVMPLTKVSIYG